MKSMPKPDEHEPPQNVRDDPPPPPFAPDPRLIDVLEGGSRMTPEQIRLALGRYAARR